MTAEPAEGATPGTSNRPGTSEGPGTLHLARWTATIQTITTMWLADEPGARVYDVSWSGADATVDVTTDDGEVPDIGDLRTALSTAIPSWVGVVVDVGQGNEYVVQ